MWIIRRLNLRLAKQGNSLSVSVLLLLAIVVLWVFLAASVRMIFGLVAVQTGIVALM
jgi:hypothetical protein